VKIADFGVARLFAQPDTARQHRIAWYELVRYFLLHFAIGTILLFNFNVSKSSWS